MICSFNCGGSNVITHNYFVGPISVSPYYGTRLAKLPTQQGQLI